MPTLGRYNLLEPIGRGGMAEVWRAHIEGIEGFRKTVAVKTLLPSLATESQFLELFVDEARIAAGLVHANIVQVIDFGVARDDGPPVQELYYIAMEHVRGCNAWQVSHYLKAAGRPMSPDLACYIVAETARALHYAHSRRRPVIHRDVSPQNILLSEDGAVKVGDFGIAKVAGAVSRTVPGTVRGKIAYLSPEQARLEELDHGTDIFAAGLVLFELLTGRRFFPDTQLSPAFLRRLRHFPGPEPRDLDEVSPRFHTILEQALKGDREARFPTAGHLARALQVACGAPAFAAAQRELAQLVALQRGGQAPTTIPHREVTVLESYAEPEPRNELARAVQEMWDVGGSDEPTVLRPRPSLDPNATPASTRDPRNESTQIAPARAGKHDQTEVDRPVPADASTVPRAAAELGPARTPRPPAPSAPLPSPRAQRGLATWPRLVAFCAAIILVSAAGALWMMRGPETPAAQGPTRLAATFPTLTLDRPTPRPRATRVATKPPASTTPPARNARRGVPRRTPVALRATPAPTAKRRSLATAAATPAPTPQPGFGWITVNAKPWVAVWIDGKRVAKFTPLRRHRVSSGTHRLRVENPDLGFRQERALRVKNERHVEVFVDTETGRIVID